MRKQVSSNMGAVLAAEHRRIATLSAALFTQFIIFIIYRRSKLFTVKTLVFVHHTGIYFLNFFILSK